MEYKIGICDDEKGTCSEIENMILDCFQNGSVNLDIYVWNTGESCCHDLKSNITIDVLFLDIELPGNDGIKVGKYIREELHNESMYIIYISSKTNYAMELFQVHPYDFLVKPILKQKVTMLLQKLFLLSENDKRFYTYTVNKNIYKISFGDIQYLCSNNKHIEIHAANGKVYEFRGKLKDEIEKLTSQFIVLGQSYVINIKYLRECHYDYVVMADTNRINISQQYRSNFKKRLCESNNFKRGTNK